MARRRGNGRSKCWGAAVGSGAPPGRPGGHLPPRDRWPAIGAFRRGFAEALAAGPCTVGRTRREDALRRLVTAQLVFFARRRRLLMLLHQTRGLLMLYPDDYEAVRREYQRYVRLLAREIGRALRPRRFARRELRRMALAMAGAVTGYLSYAAVTGDLEGDEDSGAVADLVVRGLERTEPSMRWLRREAGAR